MRLSSASLLVACIALGRWAPGRWRARRPSGRKPRIPRNEQHRTAQGCAGEARNPAMWVLHSRGAATSPARRQVCISRPRSGYPGNIKLVIDNDSFALSGAGFAKCAACLVDACRSPFPARSSRR